MHKTLITLYTLLLTLSLPAQNTLVNFRAANNPDGRILTMEETILSRELSPENIYASWISPTEIRLLKDGKWQIYNIETDSYSEPKPQPTPSFTAVCEGRNLYLQDREGGRSPIAVSEDSNITYGQEVSRNEFGIMGGIFWSPDSTQVAFYRKDESRVTTFPLLDITTRTGSLKEIKYPMAGMDSENVQLGIYDLESGKTVYAAVDDFGYDRYLTQICWSPDSRNIFIQVLDRSQKHLRLNMYDASDGHFIKTILTEDNDKYVEPKDPLYFVNEDLFIYGTDNRDGFRNLYLCDFNGGVRRLTATDADVAYLAFDGKYLWYTSAEVSPVDNHLFRLPLKNLKKGLDKVRIGKPERMTKVPGWHSINMSPDCKYYIDSYSSLRVPRTVNICSADYKLVKQLLDAEDPTLDYAYTEIELGFVKSADGLYDNWYRLIKPKDFDPSKKYPVIVYVYGGPHSQMVQNTFMAGLRRWEMYMAQRGYLVYVQDNRGTLNHGAAYEKAIHGQCGQAEMADQMEGVKMLMDLPYVDRDRIGVHGWSYGGFMTISLMTNYPDIFKVGVAGGPVIDWKWYEVMYGERYMDHPSVNPEGYSRTSLIGKAKDLKGKLLICQGAIDPVVVWEHSLSFVRECIKNNVQVDYFPYPCAEHNVRGKDRVHLHDKISMYFDDYL